jgi:hypothetical protein
MLPKKGSKEALKLKTMMKKAGVMVGKPTVRPNVAINKKRLKSLPSRLLKLRHLK